MANDITILSCPQCGFPKVRSYGGGLYQCDICKTVFDKDENYVQTNEEWLRSCTTEQLAEEVYKLVWCSNELFQQMECSGIDTKENDLKIVMRWLKQPHREEKHE